MRTLARTFAVCLALSATPASAQLFRAYLALDGSDANPCTLPQPCRLLPKALTAVTDGGEIWMLDSGNYNTGPVSVTKGVTILAIPGALGSVVALGGNAFSIATPNPVTLRNLNLLPYPGNEAMSALEKTGAGTLVIQDCNVFGFTNAQAVRVTGPAKVTIARSVFRNLNTGVVLDQGASGFIADTLFANLSQNAAVAYVSEGTATTTLSVTRASVRSAGVAFLVYITTPGATGKLYLSDSTITDGLAGPEVNAISGATARGTVANSVITNTLSYGASVFGAGDIRLMLSGNTITDNAAGVVQDGAGIVESAGNNAIRNNVINVMGIMTNVGAM